MIIRRLTHWIGWLIAHKTGSGPEVLGIGTATNDVGIISSPKGRHVAIAVLIAGSKAPVAQREKVMSSIASAVVKAIQESTRSAKHQILF